jgi:hypothetical protein
MDTIYLSLAVLAGEFIIILILLGKLGRESDKYEQKYKAEEREAIVKVIQNTRRRSVGEETNEFRDALIEKIRSR